MVIGNRYVDCFLSAGLSSHRVHHVLPFQRSGFANIVTEDVLREEAAKFGVEWLPAKSFVTDRLPKLCRTYLLSPSRLAKEQNWGVLREHFSPAAWKASVNYVVQRLRRNRVGMSTAAERVPRAATDAGAVRRPIDLAQLPPAPPTTVAVIEGIATGGRSGGRSDVRRRSMGRRALHRSPTAGTDSAGLSRRRGSTPAAWRSIR